MPGRSVGNNRLAAGADAVDTWSRRRVEGDVDSKEGPGAKRGARRTLGLPGKLPLSAEDAARLHISAWTPAGKAEDDASMHAAVGDGPPAQTPSSFSRHRHADADRDSKSSIDTKGAQNGQIVVQKRAECDQAHQS